MKMVFLMYFFGLIIGVVIGLIFPSCASWWLLLVLLGILVVTELVGASGFGSHWRTYRWSCYLVYILSAILGLLGIVLGSGKFGTLLIFIGTLISR